MLSRICRYFLKECLFYPDWFQRVMKLLHSHLVVTLDWGSIPAARSFPTGQATQGINQPLVCVSNGEIRVGSYQGLAAR